MARYNKASVKTPPATGFITTGTQVVASTFEGAPAYQRDAKSELFLLAVSHFMGEGTFYEEGQVRDNRMLTLVRTVAVADPVWTADFFRWLRTHGNMRTSSIVGALEAARAMALAKIAGGRSIVASVLQRADEPGEAIAYWLQAYGRTMPAAVKRGIADGAKATYTQYSTLKYDTASHGVRFADVLNLTHPQPKSPEQNELFRFILARRFGWDEEPGELLDMVRSQERLRREAVERPQILFDSARLQQAAMTWEDALSLAGPKVNKKALWEALVPTMNYMGLLRNLRNLDQAGVSDASAGWVAARLTNPEQVARSRQFPFRFLSAHRNAPSLRWGWALEQALTLSLRNIPELPGRTLVLVDRSGSMDVAMSSAYSRPGRFRGKSQPSTEAAAELTRADAASVFGAAIALRNPGRVSLVQFGTSSAPVPYQQGDSLLKLVQRFRDMGGTDTAAATRRHYQGHDRVIIITDEQSHDGDPGSVIPGGIPLYVWGLGGYRYTPTPGAARRYSFGGLTDSGFQIIPLLEAGLNGTWPWVSKAGN